MVDLSGNTAGGPLEHGFNNYVFIFSGILVATVVELMEMEDIEALAKMAAAAEQADNSDENYDPDQMAAAQEQIKLMMDNLKASRQAQGSGITIHYSVYIVAFIFIFTFVGFFAYKLVKSLQDKERKREEKKKLREQKKKK